jgi:hypothetical protein
LKLIAIKRERYDVDEEVKGLRVRYKSFNVEHVVREIKTLQERLERDGVSVSGNNVERFIH